MINKKIIAFIILTATLTSCNSDKKSISENDILKIKTILENLALDNLKNWEPPFHEEKYLMGFTQSSDFRFTVDGFHVNGFEKWKAIVYESMESDRLNHKQYKHDITDIQTIVLGEKSGLVTVNYIWDYITNDNLHFNVPATVTSVYRFEDKKWKLVNSHVSHGEKSLLED